MEENKSAQYTFGPEEKQILAILDSFEQELQARLQENNGEVENIKYYEKFKMGDIDFNNIFITTEKDAEGNFTFHVYSGSSSNEILAVDKDGKVSSIIPELEAYLSNINLEEVIAENEKEPGRLKGISEKMTPEEVKEMLEGKEKIVDEEEQETDEQQEDKGETTEEKIKKDLEEQGEDLEISNYRKIKDKNVAERMPQVFGNSEENGIAYSNKLNRFVMLTNVNGKFKINDNVEPAQTAWKTIISIVEYCERIEKRVPHALMETSNDKQEIAITYGPYGEIDIETVEVLPCDERIARGVRMQGEDATQEESYQIRNEFETEGTEYSHELAHQVNEVENAQRDSGQVDMNITEEDYIPNTQKTWGELVDETGESLVKLVERYNREMQKPDAEPKKVVETIEADYGAISHEHTH